MLREGLIPEVCSGTYFPSRGRPRKGYYVVLDEIAMAGPFKTKREADHWLAAAPKKTFARAADQQRGALKVDAAYARSIQSVLKEQEKALTAALGGSR